MHGLTNIQVLSNLVGEVLTSAEVDIATLQHILDDFIFDFIEFADKKGMNHNITGACIMGLENSDWYIIQIFPDEVNEMMIAKANRNGIVLAVFLVAILFVLLILTYSILNKSKKETQKALVEAEDANRVKTDFLFNMSHDIRTPMNAITGFLRLLDKQQEDGAKRREYIRKIGDASEILLSIINNVLEMSKIERGKTALEETAQDIEHLCNGMYSMFEVHMRTKNITFEKNVAIQHHFVWCDVTKVQEVYFNILNNAYKYTSNSGKVSVHLTELPSNKEGYAFFKTEIEDNGIGISREFIPHLFEDFSREHNTTHSKIAGTGLGMSIAKKLTELMGGSIEVESEIGKGTKFTVFMAHRIASQTDVADSGADIEADTNFGGKRVLLAEDNDLNAEIAMELLREMGLKAERAEDGAVCINMVKRAEEGYYDLILMDIQMPNVNGYQAAEAIRKMDNLSKASIPIIAMTANAFDEDKKNAYAAGMDAHLAKPIDIPKLVEVLADIFSKASCSR